MGKKDEYASFCIISEVLASFPRQLLSMFMLKAANGQIVTNSKIKQNDRNILNFCTNRDVNIQDSLEDVSYLQETHVLEHKVRPAL